MKTEIFLIGVISLALWAFVWYRAARGPLGWISPTCLFAAGPLLFYIIPSLYWQFRPWNYIVPPYFEGLPLVLAGAGVLGLPFLLGALPGTGRKRVGQPKRPFRTIVFGERLWVFLLPVLVGIGWRIYLLTLGWQARLSREVPTLLGSASLALIVLNFSYYYAACYFALVAFGNKNQRRVGATFWVMDGLLQIFLLHRYWIILFALRSVVFITLLGLKLTHRHWIAIGIFVMLVISVIGQSHIFAYGLVTDDRTFLSVSDVAKVLYETGVGYVQGGFRGGYSSGEAHFLLRTVDDTMYRLYEARSASAVMMNVPDVIPYFYGKTFLHVFYAMIPRYFWPGKPNLAEIHYVTIRVMPSDSGVNPAGTLAEFYMNYGFIAVLFGGIASFLICRWSERILTRKLSISPAWLCMYPLLVELYVFASYNFTQRLSEGIRWFLVLVLIDLLLRYARREHIQMKAPNMRAFPILAQPVLKKE